MPKRTPYDDPRLVALREQGSLQGQVVARRQVYDLGLTRWELRGELQARRWQLVGRQSVCLHNGDVSAEGMWWAAVFEGGSRAQLDGASSLIASGLKRYEVERIRVSVPRGVACPRRSLFDIRQTRRWSADDRMPSGVPRTRVAVAAVRGALWARTDKEAAYLLTLVVQQGLERPEAIGEQLLRIRRDRRRLILHTVVHDLLDGARSLGEIDVGHELVRRGLPRPDRQVLRCDAGRRYYLDLYWDDLHLVVEIDGVHHAWAENVVGDALRQNSLVLDGDTVLRLPLLGLRLQPDAFYAQIEQAMRIAGWREAA